MQMAVNDGSGNWTNLDPATDVTDGHFAFQADFQGGIGGNTVQDIALDLGVRYNGGAWVPEAGSSTQYSAASTTVQSGSDGYGPGDLLSVNVNPEGVITASYSNGNVMPLFQIAVARFQNAEGLNKVGNNLYAATRESGEALTGTAGASGLGRISPQSLEESNVDMAEEITNMIVFQRSYQANLKVLEVENELKGDVLNIIS
jgi:flagellar hook protein FlgE